MFRYATALRSKNVAQRREAVQEICRLGTAVPSPAIDALVALLEDPDETVREGAAHAAIQVARADGPGRTRVLEGLEEKLAHPQDLVRLRAVGVVNRIGPPAAPLVAGLVTALKDPNRILCRVAAEALCRIGSAAIPALESARDREAGLARQAAQWVLARIQSNSDDSVDTVLAVKHPTAPAITVPPAPSRQTQRIPSIPSLKGSERRTAPRFPSTREVFYQVLTGRGEDLWHKARIADISVGGIGLMVSASVLLSAGARLSIDLNEAHQALQRRAVCRVVYHRPVAGGWFVGCAWLGALDEEELGLLREPVTA